MEMLGINGVAHSQDHVLKIDRFVQKIVRASINAHQPVPACGEGGYHQNREMRRFCIFSQTPAHFEAVHLRHHQVEQNDVRRTPGNFLQRLHSVFGFLNFVAARFQRVTQQSAVLFFVIHDQYEP
jgi:hypothetical protein